MKKTITTIIIVLLASLSASAQIFRSGGIGAYGTNTSYGSKSKGGSASGPQGWFIGAGGIYNKLAGNDAEIHEDFGGVGGMFEIGKGNTSISVEVIMHSFNLAEDASYLGGLKSDNINYRAYFKQRKHFGRLFYLHVGLGIMYYKNTYDSQNSSLPAIEDQDEVLLAGNFGLGVHFNLGGPILFFETGFSIFNEPENANISVGPVSSGGGTNNPGATGGYSQNGHFQLDGIRGGLRFYL